MSRNAPSPHQTFPFHLLVSKLPPPAHRAAFKPLPVSKKAPPTHHSPASRPVIPDMAREPAIPSPKRPPSPSHRAHPFLFLLRARVPFSKKPANASSAGSPSSFYPPLPEFEQRKRIYLLVPSFFCYLCAGKSNYYAI